MASLVLDETCAETVQFINKPPSWANMHKYLTVDTCKNSSHKHLVSGEGENEAAHSV